MPRSGPESEYIRDDYSYNLRDIVQTVKLANEGYQAGKNAYKSLTSERSVPTDQFPGNFPGYRTKYFKKGQPSSAGFVNSRDGARRTNPNYSQQRSSLSSRGINSALAPSFQFKPRVGLQGDPSTRTWRLKKSKVTRGRVGPRRSPSKTVGIGLNRSIQTMSLACRYQLGGGTLPDGAPRIRFGPAHDNSLAEGVAYSASFPLQMRTYGTGNSMRTAMAIHKVEVTYNDRFIPQVRLVIGSSSDGEIVNEVFDSHSGDTSYHSFKILEGFNMYNQSPPPTAASGQLTYLESINKPYGSAEQVTAMKNIDQEFDWRYDKTTQKTFDFPVPKLYTGNHVLVEVLGIQLKPYHFQTALTAGSGSWLTPYVSEYHIAYSNVIVKIHYELVSLSEQEYLKIQQALPKCLAPPRQAINCITWQN